jgi:hypothetical protein
MSRTDEPGAQDGTLETHSADLSVEFERIDEEKERLRRLADQLGLKRPAPEEPEDTSQPAESGPLPSPAPEAKPPEETTPSQPAALGRESDPPSLSTSDEKAEKHRKVHVRRPSLPQSASHASPEAARRRHSSGGDAGRLSAPMLESLSGFVPTAIFEEMKRERDELFFRLTQLEVERSQIDQLRSALSTMEGEVQRLESEIKRRRRSPTAEHAETLRLCYRRWLALRRRRPLMFSDYLACRRSEREKA